MDVFTERRIEELERQLINATTPEEVEFIEKKLNALRPPAQ